MASRACVSRLQKEYRAILKDPAPQITAHPAPNNLLEWHYVLEGSAGTDFEGGCYHGKVTFPPQYPFKPPSIVMLTPNGRFATNTKLCLSMSCSMSDFHPESWNPMWSVSTILTGLLSFMVETQHTTGAISSSPDEKRRFARESLAYNVRNPTFRKLFPEWVKKHEEQQAAAAAPATAQQGQPQAQGQQAAAAGAGGGGAPGQQPQGGPGAAAGAGADAAQQAAAALAGLDLDGDGQQVPQWSGYLVGAAAVAAAGVAATLLMKPLDA